MALPLRRSLDGSVPSRHPSYSSKEQDAPDPAAPNKTPTPSLDSESGQDNFVCQFNGCGQVFYHSGDFLRHVDGYRHPQETARGRRIDVRIPDSERVHRCEYEGCKKAFIQAAHLKDHIMTHTGERPFSCDHPGCSKKFSKSGNLKVHSLIHSGARPFICTFSSACNKAFTDTGKLARHLKTHEGDTQVDKPSPPQGQGQASKQAPKTSHDVAVTVPAGAGPGSTLRVTSPIDGKKFLIAVPAGLQPGAVFRATLRDKDCLAQHESGQSEGQ